MAEPDELYTLRAQYWLGHYNMAVTEARAVARRPMSNALKLEREEFLARAYTALGQYDKVTNTESPGLQALVLKAQYEAAAGTDRSSIVDQLKSLGQGGGGDSSPIAELAAAQVLLHENQPSAAYAFVASDKTLEQTALKIQILIKIDRLDLAKQQLQQMRVRDEEAILTQLSSVYVALAEGRSGAADAEHTLNVLSESYGPSTFLLNLTACTLLMAGDYAAAETKLQECINDHPEISMPDTLVNMITALVHQNKMAEAVNTISELQQKFPHHPFHAGLERVTSAFEREAVKYKV